MRILILTLVMSFLSHSTFSSEDGGGAPGRGDETKSIAPYEVKSLQELMKGTQGSGNAPGKVKSLQERERAQMARLFHLD